MSTIDRTTLIAAFRSGPARLRTAVEGLNAPILDFRPFDDAWTIRENLVHLCDAEVYAYARHRKAIAEPGARVDVWEETKWHAGLDYGGCDAAAALALYEALRLATALLLDRLAGRDWSGCRIEHPVRGTLTLEQLAAFFAEHDNFHLDLIDRNKRLWKEKKG